MKYKNEMNKLNHILIQLNQLLQCLRKNKVSIKSRKMEFRIKRLHNKLMNLEIKQLRVLQNFLNNHCLSTCKVIDFMHCSLEIDCFYLKVKNALMGIWIEIVKNGKIDPSNNILFIAIRLKEFLRKILLKIVFLSYFRII